MINYGKLVIYYFIISLINSNFNPLEWAFGWKLFTCIVFILILFDKSDDRLSKK